MGLLCGKYWGARDGTRATYHCFSPTLIYFFRVILLYLRMELARNRNSLSSKLKKPYLFYEKGIALWISFVCRRMRVENPFGEVVSCFRVRWAVRRLLPDPLCGLILTRLWPVPTSDPGGARKPPRVHRSLSTRSHREQCPGKGTELESHAWKSSVFGKRWEISYLALLSSLKLYLNWVRERANPVTAIQQLRCLNRCNTI